MIALLLFACADRADVASVEDGGLPAPDPAEQLIALYAEESDGTLDVAALPSMHDLPFVPTGRAIGDLAPVGALPLVDGSGSFDLAEVVGPDGAGRAAVVAFMASWCQPCEASLPSVAALEDRWAGELDVVIYDIDVNPAGRRKLLDRLRGLGISARLVVAPPLVQRAWLGEGQQIPRFFFVNQAGRILGQARGFDEEIDARMPRQIERLLANPFGAPG